MRAAPRAANPITVKLSSNKEPLLRMCGPCLTQYSASVRVGFHRLARDRRKVLQANSNRVRQITIAVVIVAKECSLIESRAERKKRVERCSHGHVGFPSQSRRLCGGRFPSSEL